ncbi:MAG: hypothetical protein M2R45_02976 [Verrucomicrobia subdivision 3 bacterium]|nr:hypothetical protein [Limisphaerales bacterium]MCS1416537.1 hypothetical protein [Limisphaerales bacterium]
MAAAFELLLLKVCMWSVVNAAASISEELFLEFANFPEAATSN